MVTERKDDRAQDKTAGNGCTRPTSRGRADRPTPGWFQEIFDAFEFVSFAAMDEHQAYLCKETGQFYFHSDYGDDEALPEDIDDDKYIAIPHKSELDLGKKLVLDFAYQFLPDEVESVEAIFSRKGAYSRFKGFLEQKEMLDKWYEFETEAQKNALREWC